MKNAIVLGGSNGIGLSLAKNLEGYNKIYILDIIPPQASLSPNIEYHYFNLLDKDYTLIDNFPSVNTLIITAGIGTLRLFKDNTENDIHKIFAINAEGPISILHRFKDIMFSHDKEFYCAVMVSIAGWICSPFFSLYSASKAALHYFIEAVNIEMEETGSSNRILEVSPGKINGTSFYGGETQLNVLDKLSCEILKLMYNRNTLFIPDFEEIYSDVLKRYNTDHRQFGKESYSYKLHSGLVSIEPDEV